MGDADKVKSIRSGNWRDPSVWQCGVPGVSRPPRVVVWLDCDRCGAEWPAHAAETSANVPRLTTCQRCLSAEVARLTRRLTANEEDRRATLGDL